MRQLSAVRFGLAAILVVAAVVAPGHVASATQPAAPASGPQPIITFPVHTDVSAPLRELQGPQNQQGSARGNDRATKEIKASQGNAPVGGSPSSPLAATAAPAVGVFFDGIGVGLGAYTPAAAPPDPNGAVGPNHYVETVNTDLAVFTKTGALLYGPVPINTVWAGFGGGCELDNDGDPTVLYDRAADRWIISQFAVTTTLYLNCVAVSLTPDPTGAYNRYAYQNTDFPDYPKFGVWSDGYYVTFNNFAGGATFSGGMACAYDRTAMIAGALSAAQVCFNAGPTYGGLLPSTVDGARLPPVGSPNYIVALDAPVTSTLLQTWKFKVNWTTPASSTFTGPTPITVPSYTNACSTAPRGDCIPQSGTTQKLESLGDRLMYRLAYRNFGDHEALVANHAIVSGSSVGVRWYELRVNAGDLTLFQQGTFAPDATFRFMGSAAMDQTGNIGLGYSASSSTLFPSIRYTGRLATDAAGTMQAEATIIASGGSQLPNLARWGDYTSLAVDPVDDCTFWYTNEYLKTSGTFNWSTRVATFKFPGCAPAAPDFSLAVTPASQSVVEGTSTTYTATVTPSGGFTGSVNLSVAGLPAGATGTFSPNPTTTTSTLSVATASTTAAGTYPLTITGVSGTLTRSTTATLVVTAPATPDFSLAVTPASQSVVQGTSATYTATVTPSGGFAGSVSLSVTGLPAGATGTFSPNPTTTGTSTLTVTTATTTPTGSFALTITGVSGALTHSTGATLAVTAAPVPDFSLAVTPASQTVVQGTSTTYTVTITGSGGFTGPVSLSVTGLPAGATAAFSPNPTTTGTSTLTVTTATTTPTGSFALTITGVSGSLTRTATATLAVAAGCVGGDDEC